MEYFNNKEKFYDDLDNNNDFNDDLNCENVNNELIFPINKNNQNFKQTSKQNIKQKDQNMNQKNPKNKNQQQNQLMGHRFSFKEIYNSKNQNEDQYFSSNNKNYNKNSNKNNNNKKNNLFYVNPEDSFGNEADGYECTSKFQKISESSKKNVYNKNVNKYYNIKINKYSLMYFCDLITHYMRKKSYSMCIFEIANYQMKLEKKYALKILVRMMKKRIIFYKLKFFHRYKKIYKFLLKYEDNSLFSNEVEKSNNLSLFNIFINNNSSSNNNRNISNSRISYNSKKATKRKK